jgi:hypothetical protein
MVGVLAMETGAGVILLATAIILDYSDNYALANLHWTSLQKAGRRSRAMSGEGEGKATRAGRKERTRTCSGAKNNNAADREQSFFE